jgi:hypothetical protein
MRVLVTGSRDWRGSDEIREALAEAYSESFPNPMVVVHGACPTGADQKATDWVLDMIDCGLDVRLEQHPADWNGPHKKAAGPRRNAEMIALGADLCLAFIQDESKGATHTEQLARKAGIETKTFRRSTNSMAQKKYIPEMQLDGVRLIWRNFEGREEQYNAEGNRNFHVILPEDIAEEMIKQGWNVKSKPPQQEGEETFYYMKVKVSYKFKAPRLTTVSKKWDPKTNTQKLVRNLLPEELVLTLDMFEFEKVDLILTPYSWGPIRGESGVTAYVKTGFFFVKQDALEERYASIPFADDEILAIEGPDPAKDWIDGEVVSEIEELDDPWATNEEKDQVGLPGTSR